MEQRSSRGCLALLASLAMLGFLIIAVSLYIYFGPPNAVIGFLVGLGLVGAVSWLGFRFPEFLTATDVRSPEQRAMSKAIILAIEATDDPRATGLGISRIFGWILTVFFAAMTLMFAVFATALTLRGELTGGLTGASLACGVCAGLTFLTWKYIAKAGLP